MSENKNIKINIAWLKEHKGFEHLTDDELINCIDFMKFFCTAVFEIMCNNKIEDYEENST